MNITSTPEYYGYKIGQNIAPFINLCIEKTNECYIGPGVHIMGRNDKLWRVGNVWGDNMIQWGWTRKYGVKIIGAGREKTTLKLIDNVQSRYLMDQDRDSVFMIHTNYNQSCDDCTIRGITFDGNYRANFQTSTINAIRIRGENPSIQDCAFMDFGVGNNQKAECFYVAVGPINGDGIGPVITNNLFTKMGGKTNSPAGFVPEQTLIAFGGKNAEVTKNVFVDCTFHPKNQQCPLHAIAFGQTENALISENIFINFNGQCIYNDSFTNKGARIVNNKALNVWNFVQLSCQKWADPNQITFNQDHLISKNLVILSSDPTYHQWDRPPGISSFFGYIYSPELDKTKYAGFKNIVVDDNTIYLGEQIVNKKNRKYSDLLVSYWGGTVDKSKILMTDKNTIISTDRRAYTKAFIDNVTQAMAEINKNKPPKTKKK